MNISRCGIDCDACEFKISHECPECYEVNCKPFWAKNGDSERIRNLKNMERE